MRKTSMNKVMKWRRWKRGGFACAAKFVEGGPPSPSPPPPQVQLGLNKYELMAASQRIFMTDFKIGIGQKENKASITID